MKCFREHAAPLSSVGIINKVVKDVVGGGLAPRGGPDPHGECGMWFPRQPGRGRGSGTQIPKSRGPGPGGERGCDTGRDDREGQARRGVPQTPTQKQFAELPW